MVEREKYHERAVRVLRGAQRRSARAEVGIRPACCRGGEAWNGEHDLDVKYHSCLEGNLECAASVTREVKIRLPLQI